MRTNGSETGSATTSGPEAPRLKRKRPVHPRPRMHRPAFAHVNKSRELDRLVGRVEQILACLPQGRSAEMDALRDKVDRTIMATWLALGSEPSRPARMRHHRRILGIAAAILIGIAA